MSPRPLLLDLFCGAGGAAVGYHRAGFDVIGVDIKARGYPFPMVQADALDFLTWARLSSVAAVHASPPCIRWTALPLTREQRERHPDLVTPLRPMLDQLGKPYVIENVPRAPLRGSVLICGAAMGLRVVGHRKFEPNWPLKIGRAHV